MGSIGTLALAAKVCDDVSLLVNIWGVYRRMAPRPSARRLLQAVLVVFKSEEESAEDRRERVARDARRRRRRAASASRSRSRSVERGRAASAHDGDEAVFDAAPPSPTKPPRERTTGGASLANWASRCCDEVALFPAWRGAVRRALALGDAADPRRAARAKAATCPTSKAPLSAGFHSFRLIFGRAIISRSGLDAWMLFPEPARAERSRRSDVESPPFPGGGASRRSSPRARSPPARPTGRCSASGAPRP